MIRSSNNKPNRDIYTSDSDADDLGAAFKRFEKRQLQNRPDLAANLDSLNNLLRHSEERIGRDLNMVAKNVDKNKGN